MITIDNRVNTVILDGNQYDLMWRRIHQLDRRLRMMCYLLSVSVVALATMLYFYCLPVSHGLMVR